VRWLEQGEQCSQYFFSRHRAPRTTSRLSVVRDDDGFLFASARSRQFFVTSFWSQLYAAPDLDSHVCDTCLSPLDMPTLSPEEVTLLSAPVTAAELMAVVCQLPLCKSPGPDGLPYEWYRTYLPFLAPLLLELFNGILNGDALPASWFTTTLTLL